MLRGRIRSVATPPTRPRTLQPFTERLQFDYRRTVLFESSSLNTQKIKSTILRTVVLTLRGRIRSAATPPTRPRTLQTFPERLQFALRQTVLFESSSLNTQKIKSTLKSELYFGAPKRIRTHDLLVRSQTLYPTELPAQNILKCIRLFQTAIV